MPHSWNFGRKSTPAHDAWGGALDDIGIWNRALTPEEVMALYLAAPPVAGCTDETACNFNPDANADDGSCVASGCLEPAACNFNPLAGCTGEACDYTCCPGPGCCGAGTVWDAEAEVCVPWAVCPDPNYNPDFDGDGTIAVTDLLALLTLFEDVDSDGDGIFDSMDDCFGVYDGCGVCGGVGVDLDEDGICDDVDPCVGTYDVVGVCGGSCNVDADGDGVCDTSDPCVGVLDACGVCNGPGAIYACGCADVPAGACDCEGNALDALGECGGPCAADADGDGTCDDVDLCVGVLDECGVCNGPGPSVPVIDQIIFVTDSAFIPQINYWFVYTFAVDTLYTYVCPVLGCTDSSATNFNPSAAVDDGSCLYGPAQCGGLSTVTFDGHTYALVGIGTQCWFAENLRSDNYLNGDPIQGNLSDAQWSSTDSGAQAEYNNDSGSLATYGRLYNWYAVNDARGLCPTGFHVPSDGEWMTLEIALGMTANQANSNGWRGSDQGAQLKSSANDDFVWDGSNSSEFGGLPGGYRDSNNGSYNYHGAYGHWWTSTNIGPNSWNRALGSGEHRILRSNDLIRSGLSVRCVRNLDLNICQDPDGDGVCAEDEVSGCTDEAASNFNSAATENDGSCIYPGPVQCGGAATVTFDGHTYALVGIGTQCWFAENLRSDNYRNGDPIPGNLDDPQWTSTTEGAQTVYGEGNSTVYDGSSDEAANLESFGRLYNWFAVNDSRGLCPTGFHVPSDGDWIVLENSLGGSQLAGASLKASEPAWDGTNSSGFSALPGGFRDGGNGNFTDQGDLGLSWSSSPNGTLAWYRNMGSGYSNVFRYDHYARFGFSVRCVRD